MRFINHIFICSLLTAPAFICRADVNPIRTISKTPTEVRRLTPRNAQTLQLAIFRIGDNRSDILVHLYSDSGAKSTSAHLDLFVWRNGRFSRIHSLKLQRPEVYRVPPAPPIAEELVAFQIHGVQWLDFKKQIHPIIAVRVPNFRGFDEGKIRLFIFANGVKEQPIQQDFDYFDGWGVSQLLSFGSPDKQGKVQLSDNYERTQGGPDYVESRSTIYEWNGKQFVLVK
jgi:hypothetical protein